MPVQKQQTNKKQKSPKGNKKNVETQKNCLFLRNCTYQSINKCKADKSHDEEVGQDVDVVLDKVVLDVIPQGGEEV